MAQKHNAEYTEQPMTRDGRIQGPSRRYRRLRHPIFPAALWAAKNPLLQRGEIGFEIDTHKAKVGDGVTYWNDLPYSFIAEAEWGSIVGDIADQTDLQNALNAKQDTLTAGANITITNNVISSTAQESFYRGSFNEWADVPTNTSLYQEDIHGNRIPQNTDFIVVEDASQFVPSGSLMHKLVVENLAATEAFTIRITDENGVSQKYYYEPYVRQFVAIDDYYSLKYQPGAPGIWYIKTNDGSPIILKGTTYQSGEAQLCLTTDPATPFDAGMPPSAGEYTGAWRFAYYGVWSTAGITGWTPQYKIENTLPIADGETLGIAKLYTTTGQNTDGAVTQKLVTDQLGTKQDTISATDGITLTGTTLTNSGVRAVASGTANGTISVNTNGTSADVTVTGLGSAAYTSSGDYATSAQGTKADTAVQPADLATVATTGDYDDLLNKPTMPAAQVNSDWNAISGVAQILNKPTLAAVATSGAYSDLSGIPSLATVATSGDYDDLLNKPTIPTVNNATLTIQKNGTTVQTFTANQSTNATANISVPTKTSDITNDSGFITSSALAPYALSADLATVATSGDYDDLSNKPTIPTVNNATLTIQKNGTTVKTFTANASSNVTANITVPTKISDLTNDSNFANTDLSNLTSTGANISNWSSNVSNCITEIPQDIKLELNNDTLTLKAGSKVYVPNGADVFNAITTSSDLTLNSVGLGSENILIFYTNGSLMARPISACFSGPTQPTVTTTTAEWYDTTNNVIKHTVNTGSTWTTPGISFPVCECSRSSGTLTGIVKTFNGFGYIGSTVFALPGVKHLRPKGRNADGTLKNIAATTTTVLTVSTNGSYTGLPIGLGSTLALYWYVYDGQTNLINNADNGPTIVGTINTTTGGKITSFNIKPAFHALDYNDGDFIANQSMPSDRYIDLTLGTSGTNYTAPADGYYSLAKQSGAVNQFISVLYSGAYSTGAVQPINGNNTRILFPVRKGQTVQINYSLSGVTQYFRFIYAVGAK